MGRNTVTTGPQAGILPGKDSLANLVAFRAFAAGAGIAVRRVLYLPAGTYHFADSLILPSHLIIRGADAPHILFAYPGV